MTCSGGRYSVEVQLVSTVLLKMSDFGLRRVLWKGDVCRRRKTRCVPSCKRIYLGLAVAHSCSSIAAEPEGGHCEYCSSNGIACSFAPKVQGPPQTYVEALELRLETTQELLRNLSTSAGVDLVSLAHHPSGPDSAQKLQQAIRALQQTESDRNNAPFGLPPPQQYHPPSRRLQGVLDGVSPSFGDSGRPISARVLICGGT